MKQINTIHILMVITFAFIFSGCEDYLDVKPEDKFLETQLFENEVGVNNAINGIYINIAKRNLYGENLSMGVLDVMAQRYTTSTQHNMDKYRTYDYSDGGVKGRFDNIWTNAYVNVLNINAFLNSVENTSVITDEKKAILKGEAYALRAMLHFDLLRIFGPIYNTADSISPAIPYAKAAEAKLADILPANEVISQTLADLKTAEILLEKDPVREEGNSRDLLGDLSDFYKMRQYRLNYFAVKALQARVELYRGNKPAALTAAKTVIDEASEFFPWVDPTDVISNKDNPNRVLSSEILFGLHNNSMYDVHKGLFAPTLRDNSILIPNSARLGQVFENNENDYRYIPNWIIPSTGSRSDRTFFKFDDVKEKSMPFRYLQPILRMSELYLIVAECEQDPTLAFEYFNTLRYNRGLIDVDESADLEAEIGKEYKKEFWGEGQLFFYFKRLNKEKIMAGDKTSTHPYYMLTMGPETYVVPLPESEVKYRN